MDKQQNLSFFEDELAQVRTKKKEFLAMMDGLIPWADWVAEVKPHYYEGKMGNKPYDLSLMLRIYVLQNLYTMSDMETAESVKDSRAFSEFCGVASSNQVPDGDTIGRFRNRLEKANLQKKLFSQVVGLLAQKKLILKKGTIVDSTIIRSPSSTKNKECRRDSEAGHTKKGNAWYFGYKSHIGVDAETGLVHSNFETAANVHDVNVAHELVCGEEEFVCGDSGYLGAGKKGNAKTKNTKGKKIKYKICRRPSQLKKHTGRSLGQLKRHEHEKSSVRVKVEHVFGVVKNIFRFRKIRYKGLQKFSAKMTMVLALANLYLFGTRMAKAGQ